MKPRNLQSVRLFFEEAFIKFKAICLFDCNQTINILNKILIFISVLIF